MQWGGCAAEPVSYVVLRAVTAANCAVARAVHAVSPGRAPSSAAQPEAPIPNTIARTVVPTSVDESLIFIFVSACDTPPHDDSSYSSRRDLSAPHRARVRGHRGGCAAARGQQQRARY